MTIHLKVGNTKQAIIELILGLWQKRLIDTFCEKRMKKRVRTKDKLVQPRIAFWRRLNAGKDFMHYGDYLNLSSTSQVDVGLLCQSQVPRQSSIPCLWRHQQHPGTHSWEQEVFL